MIRTYCPICEDTKISKLILLQGQVTYRSKVCKECESKIKQILFSQVKKVDD